MGKKGSWFSAIKKVFTHSSKEKVAEGTEKKSWKEEQKRKKGPVKLKHGDGHSFIPLFRKPSSIEKILGEAEREHQITNQRPPNQPELPKVPPHVTPPPPPTRPAAPLKVVTSQRASNAPRVGSPPRDAAQSTSPQVTSPPLQRTSPHVTPPSPPTRSANPLKEAASPRASTAPRVGSPPRDAAHPTSPWVTSPPLQRVASPARVATSVNAATPARVPSQRFVRQHRPEPTLKEQHICATKIQATYRGYVARRSYRALRGLVRLQAVVKGQSVKRQTANALKCMQSLVSIQNEFHSRRVQMLENQALKRQKNDKDQQSIFSKWNLDEWEDSTLTKEEVEARMQRKVGAIARRERAMAYAYSHKSWKSTPRTTASALMNIQSGGFPYWWNWLEQPQMPPRTPTNPSQSSAIRSYHQTPMRPSMNFKGSSPLPHSSNFRQPGLGFDHPDTPTSTKSAFPSRTKLVQTPPGRLQQKITRGSTSNSPFNGAAAFRDDDSLTSCPPFSIPRYMSPTASAKAKLRGGREQFPDSASSTADESNRRVSFPLGQEFKWRKGPLFFNKESGSRKGLTKNQSFQSVGNMSVDSTVSMPVMIGRKPFNRFV